jgi:hypothetical protein
MGEITPFPTRGFPLRLISSTPAPPESEAVAPAATGDLPLTGGRRGEYALGDVARDLKIAHFRCVRTIIEKLRVLAEHDGMPLPVTPRIERGRMIKGPRSIHMHSRWDAGEFDAWLDRRSPSGPAAAGTVPPPIRAAMQARALELARA